jgi:hypothetical protein
VLTFDWGEVARRTLELYSALERLPASPAG